jgi:hypothetical protein
MDVRRCIMRLSAAPNNMPCKYTRGQIGWWDADGDSIPDVHDTFPETVLIEHAPDPCTTSTPTYTGSCRVVPLPNLNFLGEGHDISLERIAGVEFRVDGSAWGEATPADGDWDEAEEDYLFTTDPLLPGLHVIEARAVQTCGNSDTSYAVDSLTVSDLAGTEGRPDRIEISLNVCPVPFGGQVEISYNVPGLPGEVTLVSLRIYDITGREVSHLVEESLSPGARRVVWDGMSSDGRPVPSGIYFIRMTANDGAVVRKIPLVR